jgi:oligopeptide/dipeptide ABC transporter ATP-binding protein
VALARALTTSPECILLDEAVSALDVSIRAQIMNLLREIQERLGVSYLFIAHDLAVVKYVSTRIGVMYLGQLVETASSDELYARPLHPYTQVLLSNALPGHPDDAREEVILRGEVPSAFNPPAGCRFHPRCPHAMPRCSADEPALVGRGPGHRVACHLYD